MEEIVFILCILAVGYNTFTAMYVYLWRYQVKRLLLLLLSLSYKDNRVMNTQFHVVVDVT